MKNNSLINLHTLDAAPSNGVRRYFYSSSACIYPEYGLVPTYRWIGIEMASRAYS